jgi:hypothetical protein
MVRNQGGIDVFVLERLHEAFDVGIVIGIAHSGRVALHSRVGQSFTVEAR